VNVFVRDDIALPETRSLLTNCPRSQNFLGRMSSKLGVATFSHQSFEEKPWVSLGLMGVQSFRLYGSPMRRGILAVRMNQPHDFPLPFDIEFPA
jgi:hypothetical protein